MGTTWTEWRNFFATPNPGKNRHRKDIGKSVPRGRTRNGIRMAPLSENEISEMFEKHRDQIFRFILSLSQNRDIAEDLTQDVFMKAYKNRELFKGDTQKFLSWAMIIARNSYYNHNRKEKRILVQDSIQLEQQVDDPSNRPEFHIEKKILQEKIRDAILCLPEPEKSVLIYREFHGKTLEETAKTLGMSVRNLSRKVLRAMELLRAELIKRGIEP